MSDKAQRRLLSLLVVATFMALEIPLKKLVAEQVPAKRGPREDVVEAVLQGWRGWCGHLCLGFRAGFGRAAEVGF